MPRSTKANKIPKVKKSKNDAGVKTRGKRKKDIDTLDVNETPGVDIPCSRLKAGDIIITKKGTRYKLCRGAKGFHLKNLYYGSIGTGVFTESELLEKHQVAIEERVDKEDTEEVEITDSEENE